MAAVLVLAAGCSTSPPSISNVAPPKDAVNVSSDAPIEITFDREVNQQSVVDHLSVTPEIPGCGLNHCGVMWNARKLSLLHIDHALAPATRYRVTLRAGYLDANNDSSPFDHSWEFTTEDAPSLQSTTPADGTVGVATDADLVVQFSRAMASPGTDRLSLNPPTDIHLELDPADPSRIIVAPIHPLLPLTRYQLRLGANLEDQHGSALGKEKDVTFTTGASSFTRSVAFVVLDSDGQTGSRIAALRPPPTLAAPAPTLRLLHQGSAPIADFGWAAAGQALYVLEGPAPGRLLRVSPADDATQVVAEAARSMAASPRRDEVAYVDADRLLHLWSPAGTVPVPQAGAQAGRPEFSGDGQRLALRLDSDVPGSDDLAILDRATLSRTLLDGVSLAGQALTWSPDGTSLAFAQGADRAGAWIYRPLADATPQRLSEVAPSDVAWSGDGLSLFGVFPTGLERASSRPVGGQFAGFDPVPGSAPADSAVLAPPFDKRLLFVRSAAGEPQLWLMNVDGSGLRQLTFQTYDPQDDLPRYGVALPRWAPAG